MALDPRVNFGKVTVSTGYDASAVSIVLSSGEGAKLPSTHNYNLVWWNSTDYSDPTDDPNAEIVRVTARTTDTLTVTRGQESITASTKNTASKTYRMVLAITKKMIDDIESQGADISARVYHNTTQSIADVTSTNLAFNSERWDTNVIHDNATNNSRLTCKTAGKYYIHASIAFAGNTTGVRQVTLWLNGATAIAVNKQNATSDGGQCTLCISTCYDLAVNDYVEVRVYQSSTISLGIASGGNYTPEFGMIKVA